MKFAWARASIWRWISFEAPLHGTPDDTHAIFRCCPASWVFHRLGLVKSRFMRERRDELLTVSRFYGDLRAGAASDDERGPRRACQGIIIIKLLDPTHQAESRFTALLTRMNDYVSDPNLDARYRIIQLATYLRSHSIMQRYVSPDVSFECTINLADNHPWIIRSTRIAENYQFD